MKRTDHTNDGQQRILKTISVMFGHEIDGLAPGQIAKLVGCTASSTTRDLFNLEKAGMAERLPHNNHYRISPLLGKKAMMILDSIDKADRRITETKQRFTRIDL